MHEIVGVYSCLAPSSEKSWLTPSPSLKRLPFSCGFAACDLIGCKKTSGDTDRISSIPSDVCCLLPGHSKAMLRCVTRACVACLVACRWSVWWPLDPCISNRRTSDYDRTNLDCRKQTKLHVLTVVYGVCDLKSFGKFLCIARTVSFKLL